MQYLSKPIRNYLAKPIDDTKTSTTLIASGGFSTGFSSGFDVYNVNNKAFSTGFSTGFARDDR